MQEDREVKIGYFKSSTHIEKLAVGLRVCMGERKGEKDGVRWSGLLACSEVEWESRLLGEIEEVRKNQLVAG